MNLLTYFKQLLFPSYCLNCQKIWPYLCKTCSQLLTTHPDMCIWCHRPTKHARVCLQCRKQRPLQWVLVWFVYNDLSKKLITQIKYQRKYEVIDFLAGKLALVIQSHPFLGKRITENQVSITYVPMHWRKKLFYRGFNQSRLLAEAVARKLNIPCIPTCHKKFHTKSQMKQHRNQRLGMSEKLFVSESEIPTNTLLIIDDVSTTWTTLKRVWAAIANNNPHCSLRWCVVARHH